LVNSQNSLKLSFFKEFKKETFKGNLVLGALTNNLGQMLKHVPKNAEQMFEVVCDSFCVPRCHENFPFFWFTILGFH